ncbi:MAG: HAD family phosphatase [Rhodospirillales bacterium]
MTDARALFLDFDGTLADSVPLMRAAYRRFLKQYGHEGSDDEFTSLMGPPLPEIADILKRKYALGPSVADLVRSYHVLIRDFYTRAEPMPGVRDLLERVHRAGWIVGVVTSGDEADVGRWLDHWRLNAYVTFVVGADSVRRGKPDPEPYEVAIRKSGCRVADIIAIEDAPKGAASAVAAGLHTIVIGPAPDDKNDWPAVKGFVHSFDELMKTVLHV